MKENKNFEIKEDLKSIIDAAFCDYDDYVTECHESGVDVTEDVEDFVADAIIKAGYVKQNATDINDGSNCGDCKNRNDHIEEMAKDLCPLYEEYKTCETCDAVLDIGDEPCVYKCMAELMIAKGYRKQSKGEWKIKSEIHQMFDDVDEELYVECPFCKRTFWVPYEFEDEKIFEYAREHYPYCNCGAKMKGGEGE